LSDKFDGRVLDSNGVEIGFTCCEFKRFKKLHLLERNRKTGKRRIKESAFKAMAAGDGLDFNLMRSCRSVQIGDERGANLDQREVYQEERRSLGYVIENGRLPVKLSGKL